MLYLPIAQHINRGLISVLALISLINAEEKWFSLAVSDSVTQANIRKWRWGLAYAKVKGHKATTVQGCLSLQGKTPLLSW